MSNVLIVGATRGIGLELSRQYAADGARVYATYRNAQDAPRLRELGCRPLALDVRDATAIAGFGRHFDGERLDLAIINAGVAGPRTSGIASITQADFDTVMHTNVLAAMQLLPVLAPALVKAQGKLAVISSRMGSSTLMMSPSSWLYRASKAALNSVVKAASLDLGPKGVVCMAFHPGWVKTDMGGMNADLDVVTSVTGLRRVIDSANASHNGKFLNYTGEQFEW
ncbi:MAG: SDR family oxidoreductase [Burkholderiales bacterium]|nr:SDR family oxidoreductase [Burkholderiales bacterium]